jgi:flavodoxin
MRTLVTYLSLTGNTRKVAEAIYEELPEPKDLKELGQVDDLSGYDLTFIGFPIHSSGQPDLAAVDFLRQKAVGQRVAIFVTHAASEDFPLISEWMESCRQAADRTKLLGSFHCQGALSEQQLTLMRSSPDPKVREWAERAIHSAGQPDASRLEKARAFVHEVLDRYDALSLK